MKTNALRPARSNQSIRSLASGLFLLISAAMPASAVQPPTAANTGTAPLLSDVRTADWWFVFKLNSKAFAGCGGEPEVPRACPFGGELKSYARGQQYVFASSENKALQKGDGCSGASNVDPVGATFSRIYSGAWFYVIWNDQFYNDPKIDGCGESCASPWGHSKGVLAWNNDGDGIVMQVSTPSWPASGNSNFPRAADGNTLGCIDDDNVKVSQHFFSLRLTKQDVMDVLQALSNASVVTDPANRQIVNNGGPEEIQALVKTLGHRSDSTDFLRIRLSSGVGLISKPSRLHVPPWQMVSALLGGVPMRTATWWAAPQIYSTKSSQKPPCWDAKLGLPGPIAIATSGNWNGSKFGLKGGPNADANHAKIGVSVGDGLAVTVFGDLNQQGTRAGPNCGSSQNGRGGLFFVLEDHALRDSVAELIKGETASNTAPKPAEKKTPK